MSTSTRSGVSLSKDEFHGIMAAVARRINRMAMTGHPDGSIDAQPGPPPGTPPDNGIGQGPALPLGQRLDPVPGHFGILDDGVFRTPGRTPGLWRTPMAPIPPRPQRNI